MQKLYLIGLGLALALGAQAQTNRFYSQASVEAGGFGISGQQMPFWLRSNQWGTVPLRGSAGTLRAGVGLAYQYAAVRDSLHPYRKWDWSYSIEAVGNTGSQSSLLLPEAYASVRYGRFELYAGRRRTIIGLVDTLLTSGSYIWSGNALPIPKIQVGTLGFVPLGFTKGLVSIHAFFSHGWFSNQNAFVQNSYLHQKGLYVRVGRPTDKIRLYAGLNHQAQWGGYASKLPAGLANQGYLPSGPNAYLYVVAALRNPDAMSDPNLTIIDTENRVGNHLGSLDVAADWNLGSVNVLVYRQNLIETGSLFYLTSVADGLNGIRLRHRRPGRGWLTVDNALLEFFYSRSQGGPEFVINDPKRRGKVDYFNHSQYQDGWQYRQHTIGTPFLTPRTDIRADLPVGRSIGNNRVALWHVGLSGRLAQRGQWVTKLSYSQNAGTYDKPYPAGTNQFSGLVSVSMPLPVLDGCLLTTSLATDLGSLFYNSTGVYVGLRKTFAPAHSAPVKPAPAPRSRFVP